MPKKYLKKTTKILFDKKMEHSDKEIQNIKNILEKKQGKECSWEEASKAARDIRNFAGIICELATEECRRRRMLEQYPKGFHFDLVGYSCLICGGPASKENSWYDKYGLKCMTCQRAIHKKLIPGSVAKNKESWYSACQLEMYFNIKTPMLRKWIKQGIIKSRIIPGEARVIHLQLFLLKDNKTLLPPKKLLKSQRIKEVIDGKEWYYSPPWYYFLNPYEHLKKYKIVDYLEEAFKKPANVGTLRYQLNPIFSPPDSDILKINSNEGFTEAGS